MSDTSGRPLRAVLWDMDGTLVDTEPYWIASEFDIVERYGNGAWSHEHGLALVGKDLRDSAAYIREVGAMPFEIDEIVNLMMDGVIARCAEATPWRPGARELLAELNELGVPCALVTMSWRRLTDAIVPLLPGGSQLPRVVLCLRLVMRSRRSKPFTMSTFGLLVEDTRQPTTSDGIDSPPRL